MSTKVGATAKGPAGDTENDAEVGSGTRDGSGPRAPWRRVINRSAAIPVILASVVLHLWQLGRRPLAHDEAIDAFFSWQARSGGVIKYDPVYHGPLRFYLEGFVLGHFGTTPGWTRLVAALAGIAVTVMIALSVRLLGRIGAPAAALLFTISPTVLTVTRTGREDSLVGLVSVALLLVIANALREPKPRHVIAAGALVAVSFGLKETTFIFGFAGACFFVGLALVAVSRRDGAARNFWRRLGALGGQPWMLATVAFVAVFLVIFTAGFRYGGGFRSGLVDGIKYWWTQHSVGRGSQRWYFYLTIYVGYEWLLLGVALVGLIFSVRRRSTIGAWFATMGMVQLVIYSWAGEKFAWLALHPLIPGILLAGMGVQAAADRMLAADRNGLLVVRLTTAAAALIALGTATIAIRPAITDGADPAELLVTVQTSDAVPALTDRLAAARRAGEVGRILIDQRDSGAWPWAWYLHDFPDVAYVTIDPLQPLPEGYDVYIVSAATPAPPLPIGFSLERFPLRVWWLPDYGRAGPIDLVRWMVSRRTWSPTASSDQFLIVRDPLKGAAADEAG